MRLIVGIILGFLITVAAAYWHDTGARDGAQVGGRQQIVNWDVAEQAFRSARENITRGFNRLTGEREAIPNDQRERL